MTLLKLYLNKMLKLKMNDLKRHPVLNVNRLKMDKSDDLRELSQSRGYSIK